MIKEIKYSGYSASPSDYESPDGELAAAVNLIPEDGALHPILPSKEVMEVPEGYSLLFLHHPSADVKNYIIYDGDDLYFITEENQSITEDQLIGTVPRLIQIKAVGNTLLVLTENGIYYYLWKGVEYLSLGNKIPEPKLSFSLDNTFVYSDTYEYVINDSSAQRRWKDYVKANPSAFSSEDKTPYNNALVGQLNKLMAEKVTGEGKFNMPFFVRYAVRLFDSLTLHSAPILMLPFGMRAYQNFMSTDGDQNPMCIGIRCVSGSSNLQVAALTGYYLGNWEDIITSIDIFVSAPIYTYNQAGAVDYYNTKFLSTKAITYVNESGKYVVNGQGILSAPYHPDDEAASEINGQVTPFINIPQFDNFEEAVKDCQNFYLLHSFKPSELTTSRTTINVSEEYLQSLLVRDVMTDDYQTHDTLIPSFAYNYNGRLNIAKITRKLFKGFNPYCLFGFHNDGANSDVNVEIHVEIKTDQGNIVVKSDQQAMRYKSAGLVYFFYPDPKASRAWITLNSTTYEIDLKPHIGLNGAYWYSLRGLSATGAAPAVSEDATIRLANKIYTSEIDNPFFFPLLGINTVGTGEIMGICAAVKPLSQGQAGQFPLYAFTTEGVWALTPNKEGKLVTDTPATLDVCINAESITQTEDSVLFATDRGIMILTGNKAVCITEILDGKVAGPLDGLPTGHTATIISLAESKGLLSGSLNFVPFKTYIASARLIYDYTHQRIILYNPSDSYNYAYVFSLESKAWGMMATNLVDSLNSYPNALAVDSDRHLVDMCQEVTEVEVSTPSAAPSTTPTTQSNPGASTSIGDPVATEPSSGIAEPGEEYGGSGSSGTQSENTGESSSETSGGESTTTDETEEAEEATTTTVPVTVPAVLVTRPLKLELPEILKTVDRVIQRGRLNIHASGHVPVQSILYGSRDLYHWHMVKSSTDHQLRGFRGTPYKYFKIVLLCNLLPDESLYGASVSLEARYTNRPR